MPTKGLHNKVIFSEEEIEYIKREYPNGTAGDIADYLGVSRPVVERKAKELGLLHSDDWSPQKFMYRYIRNYPHKTLDV